MASSVAHESGPRHALGSVRRPHAVDGALGTAMWFTVALAAVSAVAGPAYEVGSYAVVSWAALFAVDYFAGGSATRVGVAGCAFSVASLWLVTAPSAGVVSLSGIVVMLVLAGYISPTPSAQSKHREALVEAASACGLAIAGVCAAVTLVDSTTGWVLLGRHGFERLVFATFVVVLPATATFASRRA